MVQVFLKYQSRSSAPLPTQPWKSPAKQAEMTQPEWVSDLPPSGTYLSMDSVPLPKPFPTQSKQVPGPGAATYP